MNLSPCLMYLQYTKCSSLLLFMGQTLSMYIYILEYVCMNHVLKNAQRALKC